MTPSSIFPVRSSTFGPCLSILDQLFLPSFEPFLLPLPAPKHKIGVFYSYSLVAAIQSGFTSLNSLFHPYMPQWLCEFLVFTVIAFIIKTLSSYFVSPNDAYEEVALMFVSSSPDWAYFCEMKNGRALLKEPGHSYGQLWSLGFQIPPYVLCLHILCPARHVHGNPFLIIQVSIFCPKVLAVLEYRWHT